MSSPQKRSRSAEEDEENNENGEVGGGGAIGAGESALKELLRPDDFPEAELRKEGLSRLRMERLLTAASTSLYLPHQSVSVSSQPAFVSPSILRQSQSAPH